MLNSAHLNTQLNCSVDGWKFSLEKKFSIGPSETSCKYILKLNIVIWSAAMA